MEKKIVLTYISPPIYVGYEYEEGDLCFRITKITKVTVDGVYTIVEYEYDEIPC